MDAATDTRHPALDATWTVNEVLARYPVTGRALNAFGVDTCCGGHNSLAEAAREATVGLDDLLAGLRAVIEVQS